MRIWGSWITLILASCSSSSPSPAIGKIVVAVTVDWEGADLSSDGLDALNSLREILGVAPITHYISAAYITKKPDAESAVLATIRGAVHRGDELAVHLHGWSSLAKASGVEPRSSPSFLTGTDEVIAFEDGDVGFDTDLDTYSVPELRALLSTSRRLLEKTRIPVSKDFRTGGYLTTPKMLLAIRDEGYTVDSSAIDFRKLGKDSEQLPRRVAQVWPHIESTTQPFFLGPASAQILEMPIAAVADFVSTDEIVGIFDSAHAHLQKNPERDVFVLLGFHLETAPDFAGRLEAAIAKLRTRKELANELIYVTVEQAAERAWFTLSPTSAR